MKRIIPGPVSMFVSGLLLGVVSRLLDIYTQNLGNIFSQMAIWILMGTLIATCFAWLSKEKGIFPIILRVGIIIVSLLSSIVFFDRLRVYDYKFDELATLRRELKGKSAARPCAK